MKHLVSVSIVLSVAHCAVLAQDVGDVACASAEREVSVRPLDHVFPDSGAQSMQEEATAFPPAIPPEPGRPGSVVFINGASETSPFVPDSSMVDSLPRPVRRKLLPDNMSLMERGLWGESGLLRGLGVASPLTPEVRKHELAIRRTMLTMHQIGGFLTLGSMLATDYFGQRSLSSPSAGQRDDPYRSRHQTFLTATLILYSATGLLAILSPPPLIRRDETSTTTIHKTLAWIHVAGMIVTPIIGSTILKRGPVGRYADLNQARFHQISAYTTTAVFAASLVVVTF